LTGGWPVSGQTGGLLAAAGWVMADGLALALELLAVGEVPPDGLLDELQPTSPALTTMAPSRGTAARRSVLVRASCMGSRLQS
jgi:hypothetical protein